MSSMSRRREKMVCSRLPLLMYSVRSRAASSVVVNSRLLLLWRNFAREGYDLMANDLPSSGCRNTLSLFLLSFFSSASKHSPYSKIWPPWSSFSSLLPGNFSTNWGNTSHTSSVRTEGVVEVLPFFSSFILPITKRRFLARVNAT